MKKVSFIFIAFIALCIAACTNKEADTNVTKPAEQAIVNIHLQPYNNFTQKEAEMLKGEFGKFLKDSLHLKVNIDILPAIKLDERFLNDNKNRFQAQKIVGSLKKKSSCGEVYIGLLHEDISLPLHGVPDWGVLGLASIGNHAAVISTYRIANVQRDFWRVVAHEFGHCHFSLPHCPQKINECLVRDAEGHPNFAITKNFCENCLKKIKDQEVKIQETLQRVRND